MGHAFQNRCFLESTPGSASEVVRSADNDFVSVTSIGCGRQSFNRWFSQCPKVRLDECRSILEAITKEAI